MKRILALLLLPLAAAAQYNVPGSLVTPCCVTAANGGTGAATASANTVFAGPTSGGATTPAFRALVSGDLPGGIGTVTSFSAGNLSPLFSTSVATPTSTPALSFTLSNAGATTLFGNLTGSSAAPSFTTTSSIPLSDFGLGIGLTGYLYGNGSSAITASTTIPFANLSGSATCAQLPALTGAITTSAGSCATSAAAIPVSALTAQGAYSLLGNATSGSAAPTALQSGIILGTPSFTDTGTGLQQTASVAGYFQHILQNTSNNAAASTDFIVNNNLGTASTYYGDFGINSSTFSGTGSLSLPNATYLYSQTGDLVLGTNTSNTVRLLANGASTDALDILPANTVAILACTGYAYGNASSAISCSTTIPDSALTTPPVTTVTGSAPIVSSGGTTPAISITAASATAAGSQSSAQFTKTTEQAIDVVADEGAYGDWQWIGAPGGATSCTWTTSSTTITCPSGTFTSTAVDGGKVAILPGGGASSAQLRTTISTITSSTQAVLAVTPTTASTANVIFGFGHDDTTAINNAIALQQTTYPDRCIYFPKGAYAHYGVSSTLTTITTHTCIYSIGAPADQDIGNYVTGGGGWITWIGSSNAPILQLIPTAGASNPGIEGSEIHDIAFDCRNGDQDECLQAIVLQSVHGIDVRNVYVNDPLIGMDQYVASSLGETLDTTRNNFSNIRMRVLDGTHIAAASGTTTGTGTFSTSSFSLAVSASTNAWPSGTAYYWVMSNLGYYQLTQCTGGGGTTSATTLTGCTVTQISNAPTWVASANVLQATPNNGIGIRLDGSGSGNSCCSTWTNIIVLHGATLGPPAIALLDADSNEFYNPILNGGNAAAATTPLVNRISKAGVGCYGSNTNVQLICRNNHFVGGSPGNGGVDVVGLLNTGAAMADMPAANYWDRQQFGNGEPVPTIEAVAATATQAPVGGFWETTGNGTLDALKVAGSFVNSTNNSLASTAATEQVIPGSLIKLPPQWAQAGVALQWHVVMSKTAAGTDTHTWKIHFGTTGATGTDTAVMATPAGGAGTAAIDQQELEFTLSFPSVGSSVTPLGTFFRTGKLQAAGTGYGTPSATAAPTMTAVNTTTAQEFAYIALTTSATGETNTIVSVDPHIVQPMPSY